MRLEEQLSRRLAVNDACELLVILPYCYIELNISAPAWCTDTRFPPRHQSGKDFGAAVKSEALRQAGFRNHACAASKVYLI